MDRPSRKSKVVNYCEAKDVDDEDDFAFVKAPPSKKAREEKKQLEHKKSSHRSAGHESNSHSQINQKSRVPLDERLCERDLEAAIVLSLLNPEAGQKEQPCQGVAQAQVVVDENTDPSTLKLSNCSVDGVKIGLDTIWSEKDAVKTMQDAEKEMVQRKAPTDNDDDDYEPKLTPGSDSDDDNYSEASESGDEEFKVTKTRKKEKGGKVTKTVKTKHPPTAASKKDKPASKASKSKSQAAASTPARCPPAAKLAPKRVVSAPRPASALSPSASRVPKWTPPGQIGRSSTLSTVPAVKSPGQGLRLGLSRLVRVKPLHPSVASH